MTTALFILMITMPSGIEKPYFSKPMPIEMCLERKAQMESRSKRKFECVKVR